MRRRNLIDLNSNSLSQDNLIHKPYTPKPKLHQQLIQYSPITPQPTRPSHCRSPIIKSLCNSPQATNQSVVYSRWGHISAIHKSESKVMVTENYDLIVALLKENFPSEDAGKEFELLEFNRIGQKVYKKLKQNQNIIQSIQKTFQAVKQVAYRNYKNQITFFYAKEKSTSILKSQHEIERQRGVETQKGKIDRMKFQEKLRMFDDN